MNKSHKFSFARLLLHSFPTFSHDDPNDVNLSPHQADNLLTYQLQQPNPRYLSELSFFIAGVTQNESYSKKVYKALLKAGIILPAPGTGTGEGQGKGTTGGGSNGVGEGEGVNGEEGFQMTVNTSGITKNFANQLACISVHAQRKLVGMLFFWEEECVRWGLLDGEEKEILSALDGDREGGNVDLRCALEAVEMRKKMLPSKRGEGTANVVEGRGHELPGYA